MTSFNPIVMHNRMFYIVIYLHTSQGKSDELPNILQSDIVNVFK
jgi:hypothetical protein